MFLIRNSAASKWRKPEVGSWNSQQHWFATVNPFKHTHISSFHLLYPNERKQYNDLIHKVAIDEGLVLLNPNNLPAPAGFKSSEHYGLIHFLRMFTKLPKLLEESGLNQNVINVSFKALLGVEKSLSFFSVSPLESSHFWNSSRETSRSTTITVWIMIRRLLRRRVQVQVFREQLVVSREDNSYSLLPLLWKRAFCWECYFLFLTTHFLLSNRNK